MRKDRKEKHERLCKLIEDDIQADPSQEFEGHRWAVRPQAEWCGLLGVSDRTLRDLTKIAPIQTATTLVEGRKTVLLRVGQPGQMSDRHLANIMAAIFTEKTGRRPQPRDWGRLRGLAQAWPEGAQIDIFRTVMSDWEAFKAGVAIEVDLLAAEGHEAMHHRHDFPSIAVMLRFHPIGLEQHIMKLQWEGKKPPPSIYAMGPKLWPKGPAG